MIRKWGHCVWISNLLLATSQDPQDSSQKHGWRWRTARYVAVDRNHCIDGSGYGIAAGKDTARASAGSHGDDQFRRGCGFIGPLQGFRHVARYRPGHQQHVSVFRRCDKVDAESLEIVVRIRQRHNLGFAPVAGAGIDLADVERATKQRQNLAAISSSAASSAMISMCRAMSQRRTDRGGNAATA